jgi:hypothetical protein
MIMSSARAYRELNHGAYALFWTDDEKWGFWKL